MRVLKTFLENLTEDEAETLITDLSAWIDGEDLTVTDLKSYSLFRRIEEVEQDYIRRIIESNESIEKIAKDLISKNEDFLKEGCKEDLTNLEDKMNSEVTVDIERLREWREQRSMSPKIIAKNEIEESEEGADDE